MAKDLSLSLASTAVGASTATTAGPAAAAAAVVPSPSSRYRSREDIYHNIELARVFCSNEEFAALLELNKTDWWKCLDYYKPPSNASRQQVLSGQVDLASLGVKLRNKHLKEFIPALSDFLLLDEHQCCDIFAAFVRREFMTLSSDLSLMDLELDDTLQNKIMNLYFEERWTTTLLLSAIIRASYNPDHPYYAELAVFVRENATDAFIAAILAQVVRAASTRVPTHVETSSHRAGVWAGQLLKEQKGLLDVLFMARYYDEAKPLAECTKIARIFAQISFGLDQPNSALFDRERQELWHSVVFMFCLVIVDSLDLESYLNPKKQKPVSKDDLRSLLQHMVPFVQSYSVSANSAIGFVLLAVGAFLQRISEDDGDGRNSSADFISRAFQLGALPYIQRRLELVAVTDTDETFLVGVKSVIKGLLTLCLETFSINNQEILNQFVACMVSIFKDSQAICEQFWIEDYPIAERRSLLDLTRARFPFVSSPLIQLLRSLTSPVTAAYVFRYSCSIPTAAVMASEEVLQKIAGNKFLLRTNLSISPYASPFHSVQASAGMEASTIAISPHVIQVNKPHSILHLLVTYCEAFLACELAGVDTPGSHINSLVHDLCNLMSLFNDLVANGDQNLTNQAVEEMCLAPSPSHRMGHADVIGLFTRVLSKCCLAQQVLSSLINACLRNLTLLIPTYSEEIWNYLRHESFLPRFTPSSGRFISPQDRFLQQMLFPVERSLGTYDTTLSFLDLLRVMISRCLESSSDWSQWVVDIDLLCPSVLFLHSEVFPTYNSWRYKIVMQKYEIGLKILDIFNLIMSDSTLPMSRLKDSRNPAAKLHELLTESYLNGSLFILSPLLDLLSTGTSFLNRLYRTQKMKEASAVEQTIVAALTFLKHLLAWRKRSGLQGTTLEHILLDRTVRNPESTEMTELIQVLGSYVSYSFNVVIPCLSVEVLTQLCSIASEWKPRAPSFVGFFEGTASQIVHRLIDIAASEGEESELHEELQVRVPPPNHCNFSNSTGPSDHFFGAKRQEGQVSSSPKVSQRENTERVVDS
ncbi:nucleoporin Nup188 [Zopfochytrium polystomum]|nr:nucleoporin Nup188 [Zopfochytrium polystomum]